MKGMLIKKNIQVVIPHIYYVPLFAPHNTKGYMKNKKI